MVATRPVVMIYSKSEECGDDKDDKEKEASEVVIKSEREREVDDG